MKLAFSSNAFRKYTLEETISILASIGYDGIEIMADRPHAWPSDMTSERIQSVRDSLERYKLSISNINAFMMVAGLAGAGTDWETMKSSQEYFHHPSWIEPDPAERQKRVDHTLACIDLAVRLGAGTVSTEPGGPIPDGISSFHALETFRMELMKAARQADRLGVKLLIEPEPGLLIENSRQFDEFIGTVDSPAVGLNFDMGHFYCVSESLPDLVRHFGSRIEHIHCEDIKADRKHFHHVPGEGAIHYPSFFQALRDVGYSGWITIELYPFLENAPEVAKRAFEKIKPYVG